jgi:tetratricopeptide (TPR) repeat protein
VGAQRHQHSDGSVALSKAAVPLYDNLGDHHSPITTADPRAQRYFDQGLRLTWAFNHPEAIRSFAEGERIDSSCAMCAWGIAFASGPNINQPMDSAHAAQALDAIRRARRKATRVSARERALIEALAVRYEGKFSDRASLDTAWMRRMAAVADLYQPDQEAQVLAADALMNLSPWNYWNADGSPREGTLRLLGRLERVIARNPNHPGACHLYIHALEARDPRRALDCAERLAKLMPGAGHLVHMPGHIYIRIGRYDDAVKLNQHAAHADAELLEGPGVSRRGIYANGYYPHNYHFLSFAAAMSGRSAIAIEAAYETSKRLGLEAVRAVPWIESVTPIVPVTLVTFGRWKQILSLPHPGDSIPFLAGMTWYARGVAHAALGDPAAAKRELEKLRAVARAYPKNDNGTALHIAELALQGEIALRGNRPRDAVAQFMDAARLEGSLTYNEPPTWYYPIRHSLGAAQLAVGDAIGAEVTYRKDLERFPANGWSLFGLAQALERQGKSDEARQVRAQFIAAWSHADVQLTSSRY